MHTQSIDRTLRSKQVIGITRMLRIKQVMDITGLGRSTIYLWISEGKFPKPYKLGIRAVGWPAESIFQWLSERDVVI